MTRFHAYGSRRRLAIAALSLLAGCPMPPPSSGACADLVRAIGERRARCLEVALPEDGIDCRTVTLRAPELVTRCTSALDDTPCDAPLPDLCEGIATR
jgi:hypothetical protein